ncbi:DAD family protein [Cooperia oncophora]
MERLVVDFLPLCLEYKPLCTLWTEAFNYKSRQVSREMAAHARKKKRKIMEITAACLRMQVNEENKSEFSHISPERAFADFIFAHVVLHLVVANFLG